MVPANDIADMEAHVAQATARGYHVVPSDKEGRWTLFNPYDDYRGTFDSEDAAWRAAPQDRRSRPRPHHGVAA